MGELYSNTVDLMCPSTSELWDSTVIANAPEVTSRVFDTTDLVCKEVVEWTTKDGVTNSACAKWVDKATQKCIDKVEWTYNGVSDSVCMKWIDDSIFTTIGEILAIILMIIIFIVICTIICTFIVGIWADLEISSRMRKFFRRRWYFIERFVLKRKWLKGKPITIRSAYELQRLMTRREWRRFFSCDNCKYSIATRGSNRPFRHKHETYGPVLDCGKSLFFKRGARFWDDNWNCKGFEADQTVYCTWKSGFEDNNLGRRE